MVIMMYPVLVHKRHLLKIKNKFTTNWLPAISYTTGAPKLPTGKKMTEQILPTANPKIKTNFPS